MQENEVAPLESLSEREAINSPFLTKHLSPGVARTNIVLVRSLMFFKPLFHASAQ